MEPAYMPCSQLMTGNVASTDHFEPVSINYMVCGMLVTGAILMATNAVRPPLIPAKLVSACCLQRT